MKYLVDVEVLIVCSVDVETPQQARQYFEESLIIKHTNVECISVECTTDINFERGSYMIYACVPIAELREIMSSEKELVVFGVIHEEKQCILVQMNTGDYILFPFHIFEPSGTCAPNFSQFEIIDYGQTLKFGDYQASVEAVLLENTEKTFCL